MRRVLRDNDEGEQQRATFLELFFDLVFVLAITQLSHLLEEHISWETLGKAAFLLLVVWWAWIYTTWMTNWFDPDTVIVRLVLLVGMAGSMAMTVAIPDAFGSRGLLFAIGYVGLQLVRNVFIVVATEADSPLHVAFRRILAWSSWVAVIWIVGATLHGEARVIVWLVALVLDYAGPYAGYWTPRLGRTKATDWEIEHAHFAERFQLFVIIALGESIVTTGANASHMELTLERGLGVALAFGLGAVLWWLYFDEVAEASERDFRRADDERGTLGRDAFTYLHLPIIAGIIMAAVGAALVIEHPTDDLTREPLAIIAAGPVVYLAGHLGFRLRMIGSISGKRLLAMPLITAAVAFSQDLPALVPLALMVAILSIVAIAETWERLRTERAAA